MSSTERAVLGLLLEHHPGLLALEEITRFITAASDEFAARDDVEVAVRALVQHGLAHRVGPHAFATLAAAHFEALENER